MERAEIMKKWVQFNSRLNDTSPDRRGELADSEVAVRDAYTERVRAACSRQLECRTIEKGTIWLERQASAIATATVRFCRETPLTPAQADAVLEDLGRWVGGE